MIRMGPSCWGAGNVEATVIRYNHAKHKDQMGMCKWLPKDGDLCVAVRHSGDCFDDYVAMRAVEGGYQKVGEFGAYRFGRPFAKLTKRDFHLLQAGEVISPELPEGE